MRILQICPRSPWPPNDGGRVAMLQITRSLRRAGATVDVVSLNPAKHHVDPRQAREALGEIELIDIDTSALARPVLRALTTDTPFLVARFVSPHFEAALQKRLQTATYEAIHLEGQFLLPYVPLLRTLTRAPIALRAQNVESEIWNALARNAHGARRLVLRGIASSMRRWETTHLDDCDALLPITDQDAHDFHSVTRPMLVLPCGIDLREWTPQSDGDPRRFYFLGSMRYLPNREAARWLANDVWPRIVAEEPHAHLTIAGSGFPIPLRRDLARRGIEVVSDIDDVRAFSAPFGAMLAPLFSGSGMRIKVLEAMALAKPVIATTLGIGGIDAVAEEHVLIADDPHSFAAHAIRCIREPERARAIGLAARKLIERRYDADVLGKELLRFYQQWT